MRLLISLETVDEAVLCVPVAQHIDLIDVGNSDEGALGANYPWVIRAVREALPADARVSATIGDAQFRPGATALAALGAAAAGADCIMVGLFGITTPEQAIELTRGVVRAVKDYNDQSTVVVAGYADARRIGSVSPLSVPYLAHEAGADGAMLDMAIKDGSNLFDHVAPGACGDFVSAAHGYGLSAVLAGSIESRHLGKLVELEADIVRIRGAVCSGGDHGIIQPDLILALRQAVDEAERQHAGPRRVPVATGPGARG